MLVVGGSGLIGINMIAALQALGATVRATCRRPLESWMVDILDGYSWNDDDGKPWYDYIIYAAGYAQPAMFMKQQINTITANTSQLITACNKLTHDGRLLFVSSSEVYSGAASPHVESDIGMTTPQHPRACYIESKRCGEAICAAYGKRAVVARLCLAYGPGSRKGDKRVMSQFIEEALSRNYIELRDNGDAIRNYLHVVDAMEMMLNILATGQHSVYNVGGHSGTTIYKMAEEIALLTASSLFAPNKEAGHEAPHEVRLDCTRYHDEFNKPSHIGFGLGLRDTIEWQKALNEEAPAVS